MMASKPRNISSSPTNLSPSRVQTLRTQGRSSGTNGGSKKGPSSPMSTGTAGRTPQTRRKELSVPQSQNSPLGSPKNQNSTVNSSKKTSTSSNSSSSRKNSLNGNNSTGSTRNSTSGSANRRHNRGRGLSTTTSSKNTEEKSNLNHEKSVKSNREATKFDGLWDVKSVKDGLVRLPTKCLDELVTKDSIDKYYEVEDTPVAR